MQVSASLVACRAPLDPIHRRAELSRRLKGFVSNSTPDL